MTKLIFATWGGRVTKSGWADYAKRSHALGVKRLLATVVYQKELEQCAAYASLYPGTVDLWLDSGAFTVWKSGEVKTVFQYEDELRRCLPPLLKVCRQVFIISLDQIPGKAGQVVTQQQVVDASKASLENAEYLSMRGLKVVPVHHQGEPFSVLEDYLKLFNYAGISPANDSPMAARIAYVQNVWGIFKKRYPLDQMYPTHSFGNVAFDLLSRFPFWTADAQTWSQGVTYGKGIDLSLVGAIRETTSTVNSANCKVNRVGAILHGAKNFLKYQETLAQLWKHRNISWAEPEGMRKGS